ncbi:MAG: hypothetical protein ACD_78C00090G0001, partial [uncultured bacterium (gcode 4)]
SKARTEKLVFLRESIEKVSKIPDWFTIDDKWMRTYFDTLVRTICSRAQFLKWKLFGKTFFRYKYEVNPGWFEHANLLYICVFVTNINELPDRFFSRDCAKIDRNDPTR